MLLSRCARENQTSVFPKARPTAAQNSLLQLEFQIAAALDCFPDGGGEGFPRTVTTAGRLAFWIELFIHLWKEQRAAAEIQSLTLFSCLPIVTNKLRQFLLLSLNRIARFYQREKDES